jgi:hypothetical protein
MGRINIKTCAAFVFGFLLLPPLVLAAGQRNLALHKKLDYTPKPEYPLTVHPRDPFKLTDGIKDESLWYKNYRDKTVGWVTVPLVEITIDLGQTYDVGFINIYTVGGGQSDVEYPAYAIAASSIDGNRYAFSSFASSDGWVFGTNKAIPKTIVLPVEQKARYVKLYVKPTEYYFFTDEIEVIESNSPNVDSSPGDSLNKDQMIDLVERVIQLQRDMDVFLARVQRSPSKADDITNDWQAMKKMVSHLSRNLTEEKVFKAETEFAQFRAKWLQSEYKTEWLCTPAEPMDILRYGDLPENVSGNFEISLYQWKNEYSAAAVNLVNCSDSPIMFKVSFSPLNCQDKTIQSKDIFELRRALYVRVLNAGLVADPLVLQNAKPFPILPGQTVQLWIEAYSKELQAGDYIGALAIEAINNKIDKKLQTVPIHVKVADKTFPEKVPVYSYNWDYVTISDRFTSKNLDLIKQAVADLENHYVNVVVIRPDRIFDENKLDPISHELRNELAIRSNTKPFVLFFLGGKTCLGKRFGAFRTPNWETDFNYFLAHLRDFMINNGFSYNSFAIYPFDESIGDDFVYVAKIIKKFDPQLKIYANRWIEPDKLDKVKDLIDIWCPGITDVLTNKNQYDRYRDMKIFDQVWCYSADLVCERFFAPLKTQISKKWRCNNKMFWRTMPITAAYLKMNGAGFWVYQDPDNSGWVKDKIGNYGVVYDGTQNPDKNCVPEMIIPSKRWQQWREGIEDAVCLMGHKELLDEFFQMPNAKLTSEYITSLRRRADETKDTSK